MYWQLRPIEYNCNFLISQSFILEIIAVKGNKRAMKTKINFVPKTIPDFVKEQDVLGQVKSKRTSGFKRFKYKSLNAPGLNVTYAGPGIRALATFIDLIIVFGILLIPEIFLFSFNFSDIDLNIYRVLIGFGSWVFYHATFESSVYQATPGKMLLKLKVVDLFGKSISVVRATFRCLSVFISIVPFGLGIWYISTDRKKQGWHDLIAGSYVIKS
jgi:uncharacterized RDD family membrane protein YckC